MFTYTKQEVKTFLESTSDRPQTLKVGLERRGFTILETSGKGETYKITVDKELVKETTLEDVLGFSPARPRYTELLLLTLNNTDFHGTYKELTALINETHNVELNHTHVGAAYRELVENGYAISSHEARELGLKELRKSGETLTETMKEEFFSKVKETEETLIGLGFSYKEAHALAFSRATEQLGQLTSVPFKILNFPVELINFLENK